jgi:hypothetical protein
MKSACLAAAAVSAVACRPVVLALRQGNLSRSSSTLSGTLPDLDLYLMSLAEGPCSRDGGRRRAGQSHYMTRSGMIFDSTPTI